MPNRSPRPREQGTVLIIVLMFLTILMLMASAAVSTGVSEERLARASRDYNIAFQAAEAALKDAKSDLTGNGSRNPVIIGSVGFVAACTNALCQTAAPGATDVWDVAANWNNAAAYAQYTYAQALPSSGPGSVSQPPRYLIEYISQPTPSQHLYRITARGWGPVAGSSPVTLQEEVLR